MTNEQYLKSALSFFGYQIDDKFAKIITEVFPLVQSKSGEVTIMDLCGVMVKVEPELQPKTELQPTENLDAEETQVEQPTYPEQEEVIETGDKFDVHLSEYMKGKKTLSKHYDYNSKVIFDCLKFPRRAKHAFDDLGVKTLRHLYEWRTDTLIRHRGIGKLTIQDIQETLKMYNLPELK